MCCIGWGSQNLPLPVGRQGSGERKQPKYKGFLFFKKLDLGCVDFN